MRPPVQPPQPPRSGADNPATAASLAASDSDEPDCHRAGPARTAQPAAGSIRLGPNRSRPATGSNAPSTADARRPNAPSNPALTTPHGNPPHTPAAAPTLAPAMVTACSLSRLLHRGALPWRKTASIR